MIILFCCFDFHSYLNDFFCYLIKLMFSSMISKYTSLLYSHGDEYFSFVKTENHICFHYPNLLKVNLNLVFFLANHLVR